MRKRKQEKKQIAIIRRSMFSFFASMPGSWFIAIGLGNQVKIHAILSKRHSGMTTLQGIFHEKVTHLTQRRLTG